MATITENLNKIVADKQAIKTALSNKGIDTSTYGLSTFSTFIEQIDTSNNRKIPICSASANLFGYPQLLGKTKAWTGPQISDHIWTDGNNIYLSNGTAQYQFDKTTHKWTQKTWSGNYPTYGEDVWTNGLGSLYYSAGTTQYQLNKTTGVWSTKTWSGLTSFSGESVWRIPGDPRDEIYYSQGSNQYVLNVSNSTWSKKTWSGLTNFYGYNIWTDGINIYYSKEDQQYVLNSSHSGWTPKTWKGLSYFDGIDIWTDGTHIYYSLGNSYVLLNSDTWVYTSFPPIYSFNGRLIWTDKVNIYQGDSSNQPLFYKGCVGSNGTNTPRVKTNIY